MTSTAPVKRLRAWCAAGNAVRIHDGRTATGQIALQILFVLAANILPLVVEDVPVPRSKQPVIATWPKPRSPLEELSNCLLTKNKG